MLSTSDLEAIVLYVLPLYVIPKRLVWVAVYRDHAFVPSARDLRGFVHRSGVLRQTVRSGWHDAFGEICC